MRTRIKICGLNAASHVNVAVDCGADAVGFVFAESSPRFVEPEAALELITLLPPFILPVGVFANADADEVFHALEASCVQAAQIHGPIDPSALEEISGETAVIRAIEFDADGVRRASTCVGVDILLVDGSPGGHGTTFAWKELSAIRDEIEIPLIVAGGLHCDNVHEAIETLRPFAVDVSSGVESEPGVKDVAKMRTFCEAVRAADRAGASTAE